MRAQHATALVELLHLQGADLGPQLGFGLKVGVGHGLLLGTQAFPDGVGPQKPQAGGDVQRVFKTGVDLLHMRAQGLQLLHGSIDSSRDFGVHVVRITQGGRVRDAQAADAVFQAHGVVAGIWRQRCPVAGIGLLEHVGHQSGVAHAHGVWAQVRHRAKR